MLKQETHESSSITEVDLEKKFLHKLHNQNPHGTALRSYCSAHVLIFLFSKNRFYFVTLQLYEPFVR